MNNAERYFESMQLDHEKRKFFVDTAHERTQNIINAIGGGMSQFSQTMLFGKSMLGGGLLGGLTGLLSLGGSLTTMIGG